MEKLWNFRQLRQHTNFGKHVNINISDETRLIKIRTSRRTGWSRKEKEPKLQSSS